MDVKGMGGTLAKILKQDKMVKILLVLGICGIALIYFSTWGGSEKKISAPEKEQEEFTFSAAEYEQQLEGKLKGIISAITGENGPEVMVTLENTGRLVYAADEKKNSEGTQDGGEAGGKTQTSEDSETTHIILKDSNGTQHALAVTEIQPKVKGVVVVSKSAGDSVIRERIVEAVKTALNISSAKVCVVNGK